MNHIYDATRRKQSLDILLNGNHAQSRWNLVLSKEWGRLAQSNSADVDATNTIKFIPFKEVPRDRKVTYASFVCRHMPLKNEEWGIRLVVGEDKLTYKFDSSSSATDLTEIKLLINSVISD